MKQDKDPSKPNVIPVYRYIRQWYTFKCILLYATMVADLILNATLEYPTNPRAEISTSILILTLICRVLLQIFGFVGLFVLLGGTFLFRNGLLGILASRFRAVLFIHPFYIAVTIGLSIARVMLISSRIQPIFIWNTYWYLALSLSQKLVASIYYIINIRTLMILGEPKYYNRHAWVQEYTSSA